MRTLEVMVKKGELAEEAWPRIAPLLSGNGRRGGRWRDRREVVNGILWKLCAPRNAEEIVSGLVVEAYGYAGGTAPDSE